jgi:D-serine deaminase-like pyridoxal phosphate-dependent protein
MTQIQELPSYARLIGSDQSYRLSGIERMLTPVLVIYLDMLNANLASTVKAAGGDPDRLRPHVKTSKLERVVRRFVELGINQCKCATTLEFATACAAGMHDVMVAYPMMAENARRIEQLCAQYPDVKLSVLVDDRKHLQQWGAGVGMFLDVNPGMDRTGIDTEQPESAIAMVNAIIDSGHPFCGLHYYEGHLGSIEFVERRRLAILGYERLVQLADAIEDAGTRVGEVITSGSLVFMFASTYAPFVTARYQHRVSPGAAVYGDLTALEQIPEEYGYRPAAVVASRVVSHPRCGLVTCDAGLKAVAGFAGLPNCAVLGRPDLMPQRMSEEHLTLEASTGSHLPEIGSILYLVPRHAGLTVNNFDEALVVTSTSDVAMERVSARGHESPTPVRDLFHDLPQRLRISGSLAHIDRCNKTDSSRME